MTPMLTGGLGLYMLRWNVEVAGSYLSFSESDSETKFGINFGGGLKFGDPNASMQFGLDARFRLIMLGSCNDELFDDDEDVGSCSSTAKHLTLMARIFF